MKKRKFYPRQVAKRLNGKNPESMSSGERAALQFFTIKGRKMGVDIKIAQTSRAEFKSAGLEEAAAVIANTNRRVFMSIR